jgi:hypothetical protein
MFAHLEPILQDLRPCFSRQAAFEWFVIIIIGFLIRCDHTGLTSIVRWLFLPPKATNSSCTFPGDVLATRTPLIQVDSSRIQTLSSHHLGWTLCDAGRWHQTGQRSTPHACD